MPKKAIVFTDIKSSSKLWAANGKQMIKALDDHDQRIHAVIKKLKDGFIIKTIGDSYMVSFKTLDNAIAFSIMVLVDMKKKPIKVGTLTMDIRIGISYGNVEVKKMRVQNKNLIDLFGVTVNKASRMESKVSPVSGFAYHTKLKYTFDPAKFAKYLTGYNLSHKKINYKKSGKCDRTKRSARLLTDAQYECRNSDELKGVGELIAHSFSIKPKVVKKIVRKKPKKK
jgi:hypothetical protein